MTERSNTAIETAEAIDSLIADQLSRGIEVSIEVTKGEGPGLERARQIIRTFIAAMRLHQPAPRRRSRAKGE